MPPSPWNLRGLRGVALATTEKNKNSTERPRPLQEQTGSQADNKTHRFHLLVRCDENAETNH